MGFRIAHLHLTLAILKVKVKTMHISTVNILEIVTDTENVTITIK